MTVADPLTLNFTLKVGNANFANGLERVTMNYIASKKAIDDKTDMTSKPVGAGPFLMDEWIRDNRMTMSRNPNWTASPGPYLDKLVYIIQGNEDQRVDGFKTGQFDGYYTAVPGSVAASTKDVKDSYYASVSVNMGQTFLMNTTKAPFDDVRVRKAVIMAFDREVLAKDILSNSVPAQYFALKGSKEFSEASALPKYDPAGAQKLIDAYVAEHGGQPITFTMTAFQQTLDQARAKYIQAQLDQLKNIKATISVNDSPTNIAAVLAGNYQWTSWGFPTLDNDPGLYNAARSGLPTNYSKYSNPDVDKALDAARLTTDASARAASYKTVYEALARDVPWFPYTITTNGYMFKGNVKGGVMYEDGIPRVDLLWKK
jgi:peptide/nickel transport system substrate-binding protein